MGQTLTMPCALGLAALLGGCTGDLSAGLPLRPGAAGNPRAEACRPGIPATSRIPRLTHAQYDNAVRTLLGRGDVTPSTTLPPETGGSLDARGWDGYRNAAAALAEAAIDDPATRARILPCDGGDESAACAEAFIRAFGRRAFRRPLTEAEVGRFGELFAGRAELTPAGTFDQGIELLVEAFLSSPSFLLRVERSTDVRDGAVPLSGYEVATRLSFMLWDGPPDDALLDAAGRGDLDDANGIRREAERMLADDRARAMVRDFHRRYLGMVGSDAARWLDIVRDRDRYPYFTDSMVPGLSEETLRFVDHVVFDLEGGFEALLMEPTAFVDRTLAPAYGLDPAAFVDELTPVPLDPGRRAGVFTRLGFLASHAVFDRTSPILRGAFLQKHILCLELGSPPAGAEMTPLPEPTAGLITTRERTSAQTSPRACARCHEAYINPAGFAFEHYDALGGWRELDNGEPVDAATEVVLGDEEVAVDGAVALSRAIADSPAAQRCYAEQWVEYLLERDLTPEDRCVVQDVSQRLGEDGYRVLDLLLDLTGTEAFRVRAREDG
ncbi:MAG: DUF1592 domain-containing protein [Sandaracinaceae bacterium]